MGIAQVLRSVPLFHADPNVLVATETMDDAGVYRLSSDLALVQTLDFFPPLVDDPYTFGQIAAANALSDVYAMNGRPITVLNIAAFPDDELPWRSWRRSSRAQPSGSAWPERQRSAGTLCATRKSSSA